MCWQMQKLCCDLCITAKNEVTGIFQEADISNSRSLINKFCEGTCTNKTIRQRLNIHDEKIKPRT